MDHRNIPWRQPWLRTLEAALAAMDAQPSPPPPTRCQALAQAVLWIDVSLGLSPQQWPQRNRFLETLQSRFPVIHPVASHLAAAIQQENIRLKPDHHRALQTVFTRLKQMALTLPN
jgi:hypothetical protein